MRCGLCGFLILKPQTALHDAVWCGAVHYYLWCGAVMLFCGQFWCGFCGLYGLCGLVNTPSPYYLSLHNFLNKISFIVHNFLLSGNHVKK